ncbi:hypothetical protein G3I40_31885 [Streptomyces sp. SID14478]|uniref:hypothetical protein n=1 Tax=Streptomyces sp. SID14478 TaxID=2706073 RepID=UPI0013DADFE3|nr:hypothetical protein [Streptomyces sp. SID14478]NEB79785.1 hypothetical protein [Streptomyces sp. SID14478]
MTTPLIERLATAVRDTARPVTDEDRADLTAFLPLAQVYAQTCGIAFDESRSLALAVHALAFVRRVRDAEHLDALDDQLAAEVAPGRMAAVRSLLDTYCTARDFPVRDTEVLLLALHFEAAAQLQHHSTAQA